MNRQRETQIQLVRFCTSCTFTSPADDRRRTKRHRARAADVYILARGEGHLSVYLVVWCKYSSIFLNTYLLATPVFSTTWFRGLNRPPTPPPTPLCVPKISQEMSMATLINGGYYVNMGKLMTNYLLKVYCTMKNPCRRLFCSILALTAYRIMRP